MPPKFRDPRLGDIYQRLKKCEPRGRELAEVLDRRNTRLVFADWVGGGFTLNIVNTIFVNSRQPSDYLVTLLGHEACHVQQRFLVDSVQQELRSYLAQCEVAKELGIDLGAIQANFSGLDPDAAQDLQKARSSLRKIFAGQQAAIVYLALPVLQPRGLRATGAAVIETGSVLAAGVVTLVNSVRARFKK